MSAVRVILITVAGPSGHVDVGVRSDATPGDLVDALGTVIGVSPAATVIEHRSPPRPGVPDGGRALVGSATALAEAGVADGDLVLFRTADGGGGYSWPEVQSRPAEFGANSPPPRTAVLRSPPAGRPLVPAQAVPPAAEVRAADVTRPDERYATSRAAEPADPAATVPDGWAPASPEPQSDTDDVWTPASPEPQSDTDDVWTPASPEAQSDTDEVWSPPAPPPVPATDYVWRAAPADLPSATDDVWRPASPEPPSAADDVWTPSAPAPPSATDDVWTPTAITQPDIGRATAGKRFMTAPKLSEPSAGRHARGEPGAGEAEPEAGLDEAQDWQADANEPPQPDRAWWHHGQEVKPDDWRG